MAALAVTPALACTKRAPRSRTGLLEHLDGFDFALAYHGDHTSFDHPRLLGRNFTNAGAEITLVIPGRST